MTGASTSFGDEPNIYRHIRKTLEFQSILNVKKEFFSLLINCLVKKDGIYDVFIHLSSSS
ncbi:hypothetical protein GTCCBUS3UF5_3740 [Geobacillus thermoleovorans CCB_US3_UF5]|uniref:Uncharacterized protein n=1 Tax=Geobacillus thermoleovorans CCB_US3_UF5 TaxID=1111068 RepID=A0ABM5MDD9_GEOTH|nr:hypothetical protein GTCCBUS3UF5_3740 [Geobacillus thermoleovorans CCB_US3_UF5]